MKLPTGFREVRATLALAMPLVAGNLSGILMGWVDTLMVGRLGVVPLAAVAFAIAIWFFFYVLGTGCVVSVSIRAAEAHGARDDASLSRWLSACFATVFLVGILTTLGALAFIKFLPYLGQRPEVIQACTGFYIGIVASITPQLLWLGLQAYLDALGRPWIGFCTQMSVVGMNVFFNWLLIFGNWGFPQWGVVGAGIATLLARLFGAVIMVFVFLWLPSLRKFLLHLKLNWRAVCDLIRLGVPISSQMLSEIIAFNIGVIMVGWLGSVPLAAYQIAVTVAGTTSMIPHGIGTALTIRIGNLMGARQAKHLPAAVYGVIGTTCAFMGCIGIGVILFSSSLPKLFVSSAMVQQVAAQLLIIMGMLQITDALYILAQNGLRGLSDTRFPAFINIFGYLGFGLLCSFLLGIVFKLHASGVWLGWFLGISLSGILCFVRLRRKIHRAIHSTS